MRKLFSLAFVGFAGLLAFSYAGALHPAGDSFAVFRLWIAAGLAVCSCLAFGGGRRWIGLVGLLVAVVAAAPIAVSFWSKPNVPVHPDLTVYSKNTLGGRGDDAAIVADVLAAQADIAFFQEVSATRSDFSGAMSASHPYSHFCNFSDWSGIGIVSRWPTGETYCSPYRSVAAVEVFGPDGTFWAVSVHLVWPYPKDQWGLLSAALPFLSDLDGRVVVGGDFNMVPWGASVQAVSEATGTNVIGPLKTTLRVRNVPLQIDHILASGAGAISLRPQFGTDHHGILGQINWTN